MEDSTGGFRIVSRRAVRPEPASSPDVSPSEAQIMELTPWVLQYISVHYIQKGVLLHRTQTTGSALADDLALSFARALALLPAGRPFRRHGDRRRRIRFRCVSHRVAQLQQRRG